MTGDVDFAQFHAVSMLVEDTLPPMLATLQSVDKTFRERPRAKRSGHHRVRQREEFQRRVPDAEPRQQR